MPFCLLDTSECRGPLSFLVYFSFEASTVQSRGKTKVHPPGSAVDVQNNSDASLITELQGQVLLCLCLFVWFFFFLSDNVKKAERKN